MLKSAKRLSDDIMLQLIGIYHVREFGLIQPQLIVI